MKKSRYLEEYMDVEKHIYFADLKKLSYLNVDTSISEESTLIENTEEDSKLNISTRELKQLHHGDNDKEGYDSHYFVEKRPGAIDEIIIKGEKDEKYFSTRESNTRNLNNDILKIQPACIPADILRNKKSKKGKPYKCHKCGGYFKRIDNFEGHLLTHLLIKPYSCLFCTYETTTKVSLDHHMHFHPEYKKPLTKFMLPLNGDEYKHLSNKTGIVDQFVITSLMSKSKDVSSIINAENITIEQHVPFKCDLCSFETKTNFSLRMHHKKNHPKPQDCLPNSHKNNKGLNNINSFTCLHCCFITTNPKSIGTHNKRFHMKGENNVKYSEVFSCKFCPFQTSTNIGLLVHSRTHTKRKRNI